MSGILSADALERILGSAPGASVGVLGDMFLDRYLEIEQALVERGYLEQADGAWGAESVAALKKFQQDQELTADGKLGALSLTALGLGPRRGAFVVAPPVPVSSVPVAAD